MQLTLTRQQSTDQGTFGTLSSGDGRLSLRTLELPWRSNASRQSCIPAGTYTADQFQSPSKGLVYLLKGVPGRDMIEIHAANFAGDESKGWQSELLGCIAVGLDVGSLRNNHGRVQDALLNSKAGLAKLFAVTGGGPILLTIIGSGSVS